MAPLELKYDRSTLALDLPQAQVLAPKIPAPRHSPAELTRLALAAPCGAPPLQEIVRPGEKVVIVTSDITRYTGSEYYLPVLVEELNRCGIRDADMEIVFGLGIHRKQSAAEHRRIVGDLYGRIAVADHECDNPAELVELGVHGAVPVLINRRVVEADRVIVTGTIGFHYFAGFGGGRKGLVPGVAARETCMKSHFAVFNPPEVGGKHPKAVTGVLAGNPVHELIRAGARMVKPDFLLNTVLSPKKQILEIFCGDMEEAFTRGCEMVRRFYSMPLDAPADLAVVSCGGAPKDINFIQAHKSLDYGAQAVRAGGTIILLAACPDGFGNKTFFDWFRYRDLDEFEGALRANYEINGQTAYSTLIKAQNYRIVLISEFGQAETEAMGMEKAADLDAALKMAYEGLPADARAVVIPDGGTVLPVVEKQIL